MQLRLCPSRIATWNHPDHGLAFTPLRAEALRSIAVLSDTIPHSNCADLASAPPPAAGQSPHFAAPGPSAADDNAASGLPHLLVDKSNIYIIEGFGPTLQARLLWKRSDSCDPISSPNPFRSAHVQLHAVTIGYRYGLHEPCFRGRGPEFVSNECRYNRHAHSNGQTDCDVDRFGNPRSQGIPDKPTGAITLVSDSQTCTKAVTAINATLTTSDPRRVTKAYVIKIGTKNYAAIGEKTPSVYTMFDSKFKRLAGLVAMN